ncbi:MAG: hypothetical protein OEV08_14070, partial [Nitrospira sp.]|nr:hypothetical protein [Nitrospira sp.]
HEDGKTIVRLETSWQAGSGFTHPAEMSLEQITAILAGLRVQSRDDIMPRILTGSPEGVRAFGPGDIADLAPALRKAFESAHENEVVTFYKRISDASAGLGITSGGMLKQKHLLYVYLANYRTKPSDAMNISTTYAIDPVDTPLLSLRPWAFRIGFDMEEAIQPFERQLWRWEGVPASQVLVIRLEPLKPLNVH